MASISNNLERFTATWQSPTTLPGWLAVVNNQPLGVRFMVTAFSLFLIGGLMALLIRIQLAVSDNTFLGPEIYNQLFTMHGSTMMFLFAVPFLEGLAVYLIPLMVGSRDLAFPRLTAFGFWTYFFGAMMFYASFLIGEVPNAGWFAYTPLSGPRYSGIGVDFWALGLGLAEISGITAGVEIVVTILKLRAPGMSLDRMPLFAWAMLATGGMIIFAFTTLLVATLMLEMDRSFGTQFFDPERGGSSMLWQHLFWFFGHPEVYIVFIPATGIVSMVVTTFARRILGYTLITVAILVTAFVSFGLWVHHMYTTGLPEFSMHFFTAASLMVALASGTQVFAWIATLWGRRPALKVPLLYILGFLFTFVLGGMTGVMVAIVPFDWQVHDTFFLVAHFHYVLIGGAVFPILAGLYYWLPKITGWQLSPTLGLWSFWLTFLGFQVTFFPMHIIGFFGMPRRVYTYPASLGIDSYNLVATIGAFVLATGFLLFVVDFLWSLRYGEPAEANPWGGDSLEWSIESPPPIYSFLSPPIVHSRHPVWEDERSMVSEEATARACSALTAAPEEWRATLSTEVLNAKPQAIHYLPGPSYQPLIAAIGLLLASLAILADAYLVAGLGVLVTVGALFSWLWPKQRVLEMLRTSPISTEAGLPIHTTGNRSVLWWGMVGLIAILATVVSVLVYSYFLIRLYSAQWPQDNLPLPELGWPLVAFGLLLVSAGSLYWAMHSFWRGRAIQVQAGLSASLLLGLAFLAIHITTISRLEFFPQTNAYGSLFYILSLSLWLFVLVGIVLIIAAQTRVWGEHEDRQGFMGLQMQTMSLFWYFVVIAGVIVFATLYLSPHLL